jgi:hypothetical protein
VKLIITEFDCLFFTGHGRSIWPVREEVIFIGANPGISRRNTIFSVTSFRTISTGKNPHWLIFRFIEHYNFITFALFKNNRIITLSRFYCSS